MVRRAAAIVLAAGLLAALPAARAEAEAEPPSPFGVVVQQQPTDAEFDAMSVAGVGTYRWLLSWAAAQPDPAQPPAWHDTDRVVASLAEHDIEPVPMIHGSPCSVVDCVRLPVNEARSTPPLATASARRAWAAFLAALVDRYGPDGSFWSQHGSIPHRPIRTWQIWNEQNAPVYYRPTPSPEGYAELLRISSAAIKSRDPGAQILLGGMYGNPGSRTAIRAPEFLERLYRIPGARSSFDAVAVHPYSPDLEGLERQIVDARRVLDRHGDAEVPIWVTEFGWGTSPTGDGRLVETVQGQAQRLGEVYRTLLRHREDWNIASALWFSWRDTASAQALCEWCRTSGLIDGDGNPRPAWVEFARLATGDPAPVASGGDRTTTRIGIAAAIAILALAAWALRRRGGVQ